VSFTTGAGSAGSGLPAVGWLVPLWLAGGLTNGGLNTVAGVLFARRAPAAERGRVFAVVGGVVNAANLFGFALGGVLVGVLAPGLLMSLAGLVVTAAFALPVRRAAVRERAAAAGEAAAGSETAHAQLPEPAVARSLP
jgi:hypothetical protein